MQKNTKTAKESHTFWRILAIIAFGFAASAFAPIALSASADVIGSYAFEILPTALVVAGFLLSYMIVGAIKPVLPFGIISLLIFILPVTTALKAMLPLLFSSAALLAYLCYAASPLWLFASALPAYAFSLFLTGSPITSAHALIPSITAIVIWLSFKSDLSRVPSVTRISTTLGIGSVLITLGERLITEKSLSFNALSTEISAFRELIIDETAETLIFTYTQLEVDVLTIADTVAIATSAVNIVFNYLPAIFIIALLVIAYIMHSLFIATVISTEKESEKIRNALTFKVNVVTAIVFIVSFLLSAALEYDGHEMYATALGNLYLIFFPALTMVAFGFAGAFLKGENPSCLGYILYASLFLMLFNRPDIVFPLASFAGALVVIIAAIQERSREKNKKDGGDI